MKKILVIDDHPAVMEGTKSILESDQQLSVDCLSPDAEAAFLKTHDFSIYDVILMDLNLGDINGMDIAKQILETNHQVKIIIYTGYEVDDYFEEAIRAGLHGAISKTETKDKIIEYIHRTLQGEVVIQLSYLKKLISQQQEKPEQAQQTDHEQTVN
mgnify:FL=1